MNDFTCIEHKSVMLRGGVGALGEGLAMNMVNSFNYNPGKCCFSSPPSLSVNLHFQGSE